MGIGLLAQGRVAIVKPRGITGLTLAAIFFLTTPSLTRAGELTDELRTAIENGLVVLKETASDENGEKERIERLKEIVHPLFSFGEMARRSLGRYWRNRTAEEREEFVGVFTDYLEMTYPNRLDLHKGGVT